MVFYIIEYGWYMQSNAVAAPFNMLATCRSCRNIRYFNKSYQPGKRIIQVSVSNIKYLVALTFGKGNMCCIFGS